MKTIFSSLAACVLSLFFAACNSGIDQKSSSQTAAPQQVSVPTQNTTPQTNITAPPANASVALNPPHGQAGHNCDIAVGAPLNGAAPAVGAGSQSPFKINAAPSQGTARLNPAHGQPGHSCDVPVGQPL